ncbi:MAG TPA: glycosyltransferase [Dermatophilaceae bacterium]|nr:glycosyltransferase [Dermatophilaceae bacterium]
MKIAMLSDCYLPRLGGIEVQVHDLAARLIGRGHDVVVFTATPGSRGERGGFVDRVDGVVVHRLALRLPFELPVNPLAPGLLRQRLADGGFDVAHVHMGVLSPFAVDCTRVTTDLGLPTAMTWHCMLGPFEPVFRAAGYVRGWASSGVVMSAVSAVAAEPLQRVVGPAGKVNVLSNGIDVEQWAMSVEPIPPREPGDSDSGNDVRVVSAMRLASRKRPLPLLRTMARVRELVPAEIGIRLEIFGDGPDRGRLERFIAAHEMGAWVRLPGRVTREELRGRYASSDVFVAPAPLESFGIAALEARTVGLPVVGRRGSGVQEFVKDGLNGYLAIDDEAMARSLARLVVDAGLRESMTAYNRSTPPEQSWDRILDGAEAEYRRAIAVTGAAP